MKKLSVFGIIGGAALLAAAPFSLQWSQGTVTLSLDSADARIGRPLTALSVAGVQRRSYRRAVRSTVYAGAAAGAVGYGVGAYYGGYGYPTYTAPSSPSYGTGYGYGSYYGSIYAMCYAILLLAMLATAILLMATAAPTSRAIASPAEWRSIEPAEARAQKAVPPAEVRQPRNGTSREVPTAQWEKKNDQVDRTCLLCLGFRNFGASNDARAHPSAGRHDPASRRWLRRGEDPG